MEWTLRTELLIGKEKLAKLKDTSVLVVGLGGVGAYAAELICRAGIGKMTIVDGDVVNASNRNRQLIALSSNENKPKAEVLAQRLKDINPDMKLTVLNEFLRDERMIEVLKKQPFNYVVDAIDTLAPKVFLIYHCIKLNIPVVSSMGAGGKFNPERIKIADISETYNCKLARALRKRIHKLGIHKGFKVVFSDEEINPASVVVTNGENNKKSNVGTISFMPPAFGCYCASVVINDLI